MYKQSVILALVFALLSITCQAQKPAAERRAARQARRQAAAAAAVVPVNVVGEAAVAEEGIEAAAGSALNLAQNNAGLTQAQLQRAARKQAVSTLFIFSASQLWDCLHMDEEEIIQAIK